MFALIQIILALLLAPLLPGVINKTKAVFAGRKGQPLLQLYYDLAKLLKKGAVYSTSTSWVLKIAPLVGLAAVIGASVLLPFGGSASLTSFSGDIFLFAYLFGLMRFFVVIGALDTGSSFEGMGASREVWFSALAEPALLLSLIALAQTSNSFSLSAMLSPVNISLWAKYGPVLSLVALCLLIVFLTENSRIPIDDPNTHLELTMIHEVMVLDYSGVDLAAVFYAAALKLWVIGSVLMGLLVPLRFGNLLLNTLTFVAGMLLLAVIVGVIESTICRLKLLNVSQLLVGANIMAGLALMLVLIY